MHTEECWAESKVKESVGLNFVRSILELSSYKVMNYGIENHNMDIIKRIRGNYEPETNQRLMCMPDFVIIDPDSNKADLVEVKYRNLPVFDFKTTPLMFKYRTIHNYLKYWGDITLVLAFDVKPYCVCVKMNDIDWNVHFRQKVDTGNGRMDEVWNFTGLYRLINDAFPRVTDKSFKKAREITKF